MTHLEKRGPGVGVGGSVDPVPAAGGPHLHVRGVEEVGEGAEVVRAEEAERGQLRVRGAGDARHAQTLRLVELVRVPRHPAAASHLHTSQYYSVLLSTSQYYSVLLSTTQYYSVQLSTTQYFQVLLTLVNVYYLCLA